MLEESNLNEIEVSQGEESVRISKSSNQNNFVNKAPLNKDININSSSNEVKDNNEDLLNYVILYQGCAEAGFCYPIQKYFL